MTGVEGVGGIKRPETNNLRETTASGKEGAAFLALLESLTNAGSDPAGGVTLEDLLGGYFRCMSFSGARVATGAGASAGADGVTGGLMQFVEAHEGFSSTAYRGVDVQNQTIGYGHVITAGENYASLTKPQAESLLRQELSDSVRSVKKEFAGVNLKQNQIDALASFAFNLGNNIWSKVPQLTADIKAGASPEVLRQDFARIDHVGTQEVRGLYNRRMDEWKLYTAGEY